MTESPRLLKLNFRQWQAILISDASTLVEIFRGYRPDEPLIAQIEETMDNMRTIIRNGWLKNVPPIEVPSAVPQHAAEFQHDPDIKEAIDAAPTRKRGWPAGKPRGKKADKAGAVQ